MRMDKEKVVKLVCAALAVTFFAAGFVYYANSYSKREKSISDTAPSQQNNRALPANAQTEDSVSKTTSQSRREISFPLDVNKVTMDELTAIDGVGEETAGKILAYREKNGKVHDINELSLIDGIGEEMCRRLSQYLFVADYDYVKYTTAAKATTTAAESSKKQTTVKTTAATKARASFPIDINLVTYDELLQISGVGEHTAKSIIELRSSKGKITDMEQLLEIDGIGEGKLEMLCGYLFVAQGDYKKASTTTTVTTASTTKRTAATAASETTTARATVRTSKTQTATQTEQPREKKRVNISRADAGEIAECLLIELDMAQEIVDFREKIGFFSDTLELLYIEETDKRFDEKFYNSIKDYVYIDEPEEGDE